MFCHDQKIYIGEELIIYKDRNKIEELWLLAVIIQILKTNFCSESTFNPFGNLVFIVLLRGGKNFGEGGYLFQL